MAAIAQNEEKRFFYCGFSTKNRKIKDRQKKKKNRKIYLKYKKCL